MEEGAVTQDAQDTPPGPFTSIPTMEQRPYSVAEVGKIYPHL